MNLVKRFDWRRLEKWIPLLLFAVAFAFRMTVYLRGMRTIGDFAQYSSDTFTYFAWANDIQTDGIGYFIQNIGSPWYWLYPLFLSLCAPFGNHFISVFQITVASGAIVVLYYAVQNIGFGKLPAAMVAMACALLFDLAQYDFIITSDSFGMSLVIVCFYYFTRMRKTERHRRRSAALLAVWMTILFLTRANAVSYIAAILIDQFLIHSPNAKRNGWILFGVMVTAVTALCLLNTNVHSLINRFGYYFDRFSDGVIVGSRDESLEATRFHILPWVKEHVGQPVFALDLLLVFLLRLIYFWMPFLAGYSSFHILVNAVFLLPCLAGAWMGALRVCRERKKEYSFAIVIICTYWLIQSLTELDYLYRYRIPALPFMAILAVYGYQGLAARRKRKLSA